ncbi:ricin-type beta-trefoil lectin domain protein [Streptomyces sp. NBC_01276]|uniref:RICIN domain-containing protein n=1 Tax=Streptomyces sp. NBC_01276 TaxID=2903808 RepID=UPI002F909D43
MNTPSLRRRLFGAAAAVLAALTVGTSPAHAEITVGFNRLLVNNRTSTCLDIPEVSGAKSGDRVGVYWCSWNDNQQWEIWPTVPFPYSHADGSTEWRQKFLIRNAAGLAGDHLCLDLPGQGGDLPNGTEIRLHTCIADDDNQEWYWDGTPGEEVLVNYQTGKCLDIDGQNWNKTDRGPKTTWLYDCWGPGGDTDDHTWHTLSQN